MRTDRPLDDADEAPDQDNVCDLCGCYWDTPQHYYGCPVAADELVRFSEELGLYE